MRIIIEAKLDGVSLLLTYKGGVLECAVTRGDGIVGEDILENARKFSGIPERIVDLGLVHIRGEILIYSNVFEGYWGGKGKANARNTVAGLCRGRSTKEDLATVKFVAYEYYGEKKKEWKSELEVIGHLKELGFEAPALCVAVDSVEQAIKVYQEYDSGGREKIPYKTDGLVLLVEDLRIQEQRFGIREGRPEWAVAIKPSPKAAITRIIGVTWEQGLSGRFTPVAQVEPVELDGTICRNVNCFNLDFLRDLVSRGLKIGARVMIVRAGDVLPYLSRILEGE